MSSSSVAIALHHSKATGTARLVLIGIAEHDGDGGSWPSVATLQRYAGGIDRRAVQRAIGRLEQLGEIQKHQELGGTPATPEYARPNLYEFLLTCPSWCDGSKRHKDTRKHEPEVLFGPAVEEPPPSGPTTAPPAVEEPLPPRSYDRPNSPRTIHEGNRTTKASPDRARVDAACAAVRRTGDHDLLESGYCSVCAARIESSAS